MRAKTLLIILCLLVSGCIQINSQPTDVVVPETPTNQPTMETLPNPASVYCEQQGYKLVIRTAEDGSQSGVCIFPDGSECDEWAYFRVECTPASQGGSMPNPASVFCEQQGYKLVIRTAPDGSQSGVCVFPDGSECDEWAYFRGECKQDTMGTPSGSTEYDSNGWKIYTNDVLGYSFHYPADAQVTTNDEPLKSLYISGPGMGSETLGIAHPGDRSEYRPPEGADLMQWLTDHYLLGEVRLPDEQIAGTTAIHFRHERSPQSYANDQYYFARAGQLYLITIEHSSDTEDWELNDRFLQSFQFTDTPSNRSVPTPIPTALPINLSDYRDFVTYTNSTYGFSLLVPSDWIVDETAPGDPQLSGHVILFQPKDEAENLILRVTFRNIGEETLLWPTGVGHGEFIDQGTLDVAGFPAQRIYLVCPTGLVDSIWFQGGGKEPNIQRGNLEFGFIYSYDGPHCQEDIGLSGKVQLMGEMIIASLSVP